MQAKVGVYSATVTAVALAGVATILLACRAGAVVSLTPELQDRLPLLRIGALALVILAALGAGHALAAHAKRRFTTAWWDPAMRADDADLEWCDVYALVAYARETDPLGVKDRIRWKDWWWGLGRYLLGALALWSLALSAFDFLRDPRPRSFQLVEEGFELHPSLVSVLGNPTAYLALLAALLTALFTYYQLRAKVRADSRQQWIIRARQLLGEVVALIDAHRDLRDKRRYAQAAEMWTRLNPLRLELELMLNPSEKDHRLLLYLIQRFASWRGANLEPIQDAKLLRESIAASAKPEGSQPGESPGKEEPDLGTLWNDIIYAKRREDLISYILRLSHVVLKREWERVKHTR